MTRMNANCSVRGEAFSRYEPDELCEQPRDVSVRELAGVPFTKPRAHGGRRNPTRTRRNSPKFVSFVIRSFHDRSRSRPGESPDCSASSGEIESEVPSSPGIDKKARYPA